jgi:C-5 cytosine-specific DNA methylase
MRPAAVDLFRGLGGWTEGLLAEGWKVIGFDIERHEYGEHRYPGKLVIADVSTLHGSWFKDADLIVASPPCQEFSYMAMPWTRAKAKAVAIRADTTGAEHARLTRLFDACFRIQREACAAAGRHIPLIVENVRGAQPWVGKAAGKYGSFYLWGDVPALVPVTFKGVKVGGLRAVREATGVKSPGGGVEGWFGNYANMRDGIKQGGDWFNASQPSMSRLYGSKSPQRKMASAMIAKIPEPLSRHIARTFLPVDKQ